MLIRQHTTPLRFFRTTPAMACPYLPEKTEVKLLTELSGPEALADHDRFTDAGFRRSHQFIYKPLCPDCRACVPVRIPVAAFVPNRTQRRTLKANAGIHAAVVPAAVTTEQFGLFAAYLRARHDDGDMADMGFDDYRAMVEDSPVDTRLVEFRRGGPNGRLIGCCLTDWLGNGISAVYSFYDPSTPWLGLGTYMVLWLVEEARRQNLPYVYLGYWIGRSRKMAYKAGFAPLEALGAGGWAAFVPPAQSE
jgi:arginine-tRNA-protein transferase